jgi:hypothetical protein
LFAVLRPARLSVEIKPQNPDEQIQSTMARTALPLRVVVRPAGGTRGDPGAFDFSYELLGPQTGSDHEWKGNPEGASGVSGPDGRTVDIAPVFPPDQHTGRDYYEGWVNVELRRHQATIGTARQRVLVYPFVHLLAEPPVVSAQVDQQVRSLAPHENGCADFELKSDGSLPHPGNTNYTIRATLNPAVGKDPRLNRARFTLDGKALEIQDAPLPQPGEWYNGLVLQGQDLLGKHELCVNPGRFGGADSKPLEIPVQFAFVETPYDRLPVIEGATLTVTLKSAGFLKSNECWIALAATFLAVGLIGWFGRRGPRLPSNLQLVVGPQQAAGGNLKSSPLTPAWPLLHLLGINRECCIRAENGLVPLGRIAPADREIYEFIPARGVHVSRPDAQDKMTPDGFIGVRQRYLARCDRGLYQFQLEYR